MTTTSPAGRRSAKATAHEQDLRRRIELARVILISAIVFHHIRIPAELSLYTWDNLGYLRGYLQIGLLKTATSTLTIISGYLLFSSRFELEVGGFVRKKFRTLFVPLVLWNIPLAVVIFLFHRKTHYLMKYDDLSSGSLFNWANALLGLTREPADGSLHFLRNLIGCNIIALAIAGIFRKHAVAVFSVILVIGVLNLQWPLVTRSDIFIGFFLGALAAATAMDAAVIDQMLPLSLPSFLLSGFLIFYFQVSYESLWWIPHRFLGFLAVWPLIGWLNTRRIGEALANCSKYVFGVFLSHYYTILLSFAVFSQFWGLDRFYAYFLIAGPLAIGVSVAGQWVASRYCPRLVSIATGGRAGPSPAPRTGAGQSSGSAALSVERGTREPMSDQLLAG
jgi:succinoglycan biosynthesis protein ExoH